MTSQGWQHSVAGGVAGSAAVLLLHPFDVIKTRLQVQDGHQGQLLGSYQGSIHAVRTMLQREGWRVFYNGLIPALIGSGVSWSAYFTAYEAIKSLHARGLPAGERAPAWTNTTSAAAAGAMVCLVTNPIWLIKTRLQLQNSTLTVRNLAPPAQTTPAASTTASVGRTPTASSASTSGIQPPAAPAASSQQPSASGRGPAAAAGSPAGRQYKGFIDAFVNIGRQEGWRGYYKGLGPSLVLQTTHGAIQFTVYEEFKHAASRWGASSSQSPDRRITSWETSLAAAASKLTASVVTYPSQVVRSRLQQRFDLGRTRSYHSAWEVIRLTWKGEGVRGFYKGLGPALVRVLPQSAVTLVVYENVLQFLTTQSLKQTARTS